MTLYGYLKDESIRSTGGAYCFPTGFRQTSTSAWVWSSVVGRRGSQPVLKASNISSKAPRLPLPSVSVSPYQTVFKISQCLQSGAEESGLAGRIEER
jgi:hypothetical protein